MSIKRKQPRPGQTRSFKYLGDQHAEHRYLGVLIEEKHTDWWSVLIIDDPIDHDEGRVTKLCITGTGIVGNVR